MSLVARLDLESDEGEEEGWSTWRSRENGRQDVNVSLAIIVFRNVGQLGCVKLVPMPPSNGLGRGELVSIGAALRIEVGGELDAGVASVLEASLLVAGAVMVLASGVVLESCRRRSGGPAAA